MAHSPDEFVALLAEVRSGGKQAFADLLIPYSDRMQKLAQQLIGPMLQPHIDAADLVQELKLILWIRLSRGSYQVDTPGHLLALAKTILNRCVSRQWRAVKRLNVNTTMEGKLNVTVVDAPLPVSRAVPDPSSAITHADSVRHLLAQLDDEDRRLVEMRLQGHSTADVARRLGVDAGCLRVRLSRLRARLNHLRAVPKPA